MSTCFERKKKKSFFLSVSFCLLSLLRYLRIRPKQRNHINFAIWFDYTYFFSSYRFACALCKHTTRSLSRAEKKSQKMKTSFVFVIQITIEKNTSNFNHLTLVSFTKIMISIQIKARPMHKEACFHGCFSFIHYDGRYAHWMVAYTLHTKSVYAIDKMDFLFVRVELLKRLE